MSLDVNMLLMNNHDCSIAISVKHADEIYPHLLSQKEEKDNCNYNSHHQGNRNDDSSYNRARVSRA